MFTFDSKDIRIDWDFEPIHNWFGLTYASYLVLPRSILQSASRQWQRRFVDCLKELNEEFGEVCGGEYSVNLRDSRGRFIKDDLADYYQRGRRKIKGKNDKVD